MGNGNRYPGGGKREDGVWKVGSGKRGLEGGNLEEGSV